MNLRSSRLAWAPLPLFAPLAMMALAQACSSNGNSADAGSDVFTSGDSGVHVFGDTGLADTFVGQTDLGSIFMTPDTGMGTGTGTGTSEGGSGTGTGDGSGTGTSSGTGSGTGFPDTGSPQSPDACVVVHADAGTAGAPACAAPMTGSCLPGSLASFDPVTPTPSGYKQGLCTAAEITNVYNGCLGGTTVDAGGICDSVSTPCYDCVFTIVSESTNWGPLISGTNNLVSGNIGGCISLLEPCNSGCANAFNVNFQCDLAACEANCPVDTQSEIDSYNACNETINGCAPGCAESYNASLTCINEITGPAKACVEQYASFEDAYNFFVPLFCGGT